MYLTSLFSQAVTPGSVLNLCSIYVFFVWVVQLQKPTLELFIGRSNEVSQGFFFSSYYLSPGFVQYELLLDWYLTVVFNLFECALCQNLIGSVTVNVWVDHAWISTGDTRIYSLNV